jgi:hypothetical protein
MADNESNPPPPPNTPNSTSVNEEVTNHNQAQNGTPNNTPETSSDPTQLSLYIAFVEVSDVEIQQWEAASDSRSR